MNGLQKRQTMIMEIAQEAIQRCMPAKMGREMSSSFEDLPPLPKIVVDWLGQASLLYGVPFEYIVPDARMFPNEAIRFFYIDENWVRRLIDGAVSIGLNNSDDVLQLLEYFEAIALEARRASANTRNQLRKKAPRTSYSEGATLTGFLLRSAAVSGWPGMEVQAYASKDRDPAKALPILRMDRLSENVLLVIFEGVPQRVDLTEPPEGLHFGVIADTASPPNFEVILRGLGYGGFPPGVQFTDPAISAPIAKREGAEGVLNIRQSAANLQAALADQNALPPDGLLSSAGFAIQMVRAAGMQSFISGVETPLPTIPDTV